MKADSGWPIRPLARGLLGLLAGLAVFLLVLPGARAALPTGGVLEQSYLCAGDPLQARFDNGAVDADGIPNVSGGTVPGAFVVLRWREVSLQLPRTNNAGPPSYTDGKWWWSLEDPEHPRFLLRRGDVQEFPCQRVGSG
jgi:hypothetical protein